MAQRIMGELISNSRFALSRRAALGGMLLMAGGGHVLAQASDRAKKIQDWVDRVLATEKISPMTHAQMLGFASDEVQRKQLGQNKDSVSRLFAVVVPTQPDGIILAMGIKESLTYNVHRTGIHLRRVGSGRNIGGKVAAWSGAECDKDFAAQVAFWVNLPLG